MKDCILRKKPHAGVGKEHEKEGGTEVKCYELSATPTPCPLVLLRGVEAEQLGIKEKAEPGNKGRRR